MNCSICPRKCNIDRNIKTGYCNAPSAFKLARAALHYWEEPCISGNSGSAAVFFSGCNMRCVFCQNYEISRECKGVEISDERLVEIFEDLINQGANNINLVNPTHYADRLASVLKGWKSPVPIVYNSSGYENTEMLKKFEGLIDIYLPDLKYSRADKAKRYSNAEDYFDTAKSAILEMRRQVNDVFDGGLMKKGLIIRHLILPQNTNSSLEIIDWISENLPDTYISLMAQYVPCGNLDNFNEINRTITKREYEKVVNYAVDKGIKNVFIQELSSAQAKFIPKFDFTGVI
ncbi:MAG: radical SAM protein [Acetobacter sp.]|nr:radical SAM protein [Bacteroides sp.]MCM1341909.1 radical SAM protein [Acetobacter sp.]MCM1434093.1 radical SAM protein [Clostridiales bacterium]